jgi:hypothetical protein
MANDTSFLHGITPRVAELVKAQSEFNADKVLVVVDRANLTASATSSAWSYSVPFRIVGEISGLTIPYTGTVGVGASDTSTAGTASVPAATVDVTLGRGTATLNGDAAAWLATETATLTITYTNLRGGTDTDTWVVTFA